MVDQPYIVYAEDDTDDQAILIESMRRVDPTVYVRCLTNGRLLYDFLEELPAGELLPSCLILDMNMPVWNGMQTLAAVKQHIVYRIIPVFIFSTSSAPAERLRAEELQAEAYITKPYAQTDLFKLCQEFAEYTNRPPAYKEPLHISQ